MIQVKIERVGRDRWLTTRGHAGYAPEGQDIVCAAVSMVVQALLEAMRREPNVEIGRSMAPGAICIVCRPKGQKAGNRTDAMFDMARVGFEMLAEKYPENVRLE